MIVAAGIILKSPAGKVLLLKRTGDGDFEGAWAFPGGKLEDGETARDAALRETLEETGIELDSPGAQITRTVNGDVDFTTFLKSVKDEPEPALNEEHSEHVWLTPVEAITDLSTLHPGARTALMRLGMNELDIARAIAAGELASPQRYENVLLVAMRITGVGISYRLALNEFVYRRPENYLTDEFIARCNGLPIIWQHPKKAILDSTEFDKRIVGTMFLPYIFANEVWGIAKIFNEEAANLIESEQLSTSPSVVFRDPLVNSKLVLEDGSTLLIEGNPSLLDHLAICEHGVWDKGEEPNGIRADSFGETKMADKEERKDGEEDKKADADAGTKLDKLLAGVDAMMAKCDALGSRMDAMEGDIMSDRKRRDSEEEAKKEEEKKTDKRKDSDKEEERKDGEKEEAEKKADKRKDSEKEEEEERKADKARKDAEEKEKEERKADSAEVRRMIADVASKLPKALSDSDFHALSDAQARADDIYNGFGKRGPRPLDGEDVNAYDRRVVRDLQKHSPAWKDVNLDAVKDDAAFGIAKMQVFADATSAAIHPEDLGADELREVVTTDRATGQRIITFKGQNTIFKTMGRVPQRAEITKPRDLAP